MRPAYDYVTNDENVFAGNRLCSGRRPRTPGKEISCAEGARLLSTNELIVYEDLASAGEEAPKRDINAGAFHLQGDLPSIPTGGS